MASDRGKKIDTWVFTIAHVDIKIPVRLRTQHGETTFFVRESAYDLDLENEDINALQKATREHLERQLKVTWEPFYYIEWEGTRPKDPDDDDDEESQFTVETQAKFKCREIEIGTKPDGSKCWRNRVPEKQRYGYGSGSHDGAPEVGINMDRFHWGPRPLRSLVPATPANRQAIEKLCEAFRALHERLYGWLDPERVELSLAKASQALLPLAEKPKEVRRGRKS